MTSARGSRGGRQQREHRLERYHGNLTDRDGRTAGTAEALEDGHVSVWLDGRKLVGGWSLTRTGKDWILVKRRDDQTDARRSPVSTQPESVLSGHTVKTVAGTQD